MDERTEVRAPDLLFSAILVNLLAARVCVRSSCKLRLASKWLCDEREGDGFGSVFCFRVCSLASGIMSQPEREWTRLAFASVSQFGVDQIAFAFTLGSMPNSLLTSSIVVVEPGA